MCSNKLAAICHGAGINIITHDDLIATPDVCDRLGGDRFIVHNKNHALLGTMGQPRKSYDELEAAIRAVMTGRKVDPIKIQEQVKDRKSVV